MKDVAAGGAMKDVAAGGAMKVVTACSAAIRAPYGAAGPLHSSAGVLQPNRT
jgi:hypothetical protein